MSNHDELMCNFFAQADALATGKTPVELRAENVPDSLIPHKTFTGNRPSTSVLLPELTAYTVGQILSLYENRIAVQVYPLSSCLSVIRPCLILLQDIAQPGLILQMRCLLPIGMRNADGRWRVHAGATLLQQQYTFSCKYTAAGSGLTLALARLCHSRRQTLPLSTLTWA